MLQKRLQKELEQINTGDAVPGIELSPVGDNLLEWSSIITGPVGTPYENGKFKIEITIPETYPYVPPNLRFKTLIFHPNISQDGKICLNILKDQWSAALTLQKVLLSVSSLMSDPNPNDPLVLEAANLYNQDRGKFISIAKAYTQSYAL